jgi:hypothetical protein
MMRQMLLLSMFSLGACDLENPLNDGAPQAADVNELLKYYHPGDLVSFVTRSYPNNGGQAQMDCYRNVGQTYSGVEIAIPGSEPPQTESYTVSVDHCHLEWNGAGYDCVCEGIVVN